MKDGRSSRTLNEEGFLLGLSYLDISALGVLLLSILVINKALGIQSNFYGLLVTLSAGALLIPIRLRFRRKIIRDFIYYHFKKGFDRASEYYCNRET